jgi:hypothetical protein
MIPKMFLPRRRQFAVWSETWIAPETRLQNILKGLRPTVKLSHWATIMNAGTWRYQRNLQRLPAPQPNRDLGWRALVCSVSMWPLFSISLALLFGVLAVVLDGSGLLARLLGSGGCFRMLTFRACAASMSALLRVVKQAGLGGS